MCDSDRIKGERGAAPTEDRRYRGASISNISESETCNLGIIGFPGHSGSQENSAWRTPLNPS